MNKHLSLNSDCKADGLAIILEGQLFLLYFEYCPEEISVSVSSL